jgi:magnesium transporter
VLTFYAVHDGAVRQVAREEAEQDLASVIWADLLEPTEEESAAAEGLFRTNLPTPDAMQEIEPSARLYRENGALYATTTIVTKADTATPEIHAVTFILTDDRLITLRYADPKPFRLFWERAGMADAPAQCGSAIFIELLEAIVNRIADILESVGRNVDDMSREVFRAGVPECRRRKRRRHSDFEEALRRIGANSDLLAKTRDSLVSLARLISFLSETARFKSAKERLALLHTLLRDISALSDHADFLSHNVNFLLDATLGMVSIRQNEIINILSVVSVVFLPPTLVASVYGMNFDAMPELHWRLGYPLSILAMILSAFLPYRFFRMKGWL